MQWLCDCLVRNFERENAEVLKEVTAFRKKMASIDNEIASLTEEATNLAAQEKGYAEEIRYCRDFGSSMFYKCLNDRNCRRELADINKQLATL